MRKLLAIFMVLSVPAAAEIERQPDEVYRARREALAGKTAGGVVLLVAPDDRDAVDVLFGFRQDPNFFYLTGWTEPGAALLIAPALPAVGGRPARPYIEVFFVPARNPSVEAWHGPRLAPDDADARRRTGFERVEPIDTLRTVLRQVLAERGTVLTDTRPEAPAALVVEWLRRAQALPYYHSIADVRPLLAGLRVIKDPGEIALLQRSVDATIDAHLAAMRAVRPTVSEREIHGLMLAAMMRHEGCQRPGYGPIVAAGANSTVLHYKESTGRLGDGDVIKIDVGSECSGYVADITRTLPINGRFTPRQREIYEIVLGAQEAAIAAFEAGRSTIGRTGPHSLYRVAYDHIEGHGLGRYFIHGLSHYTGLNVHDPGDTSQPLQPGMVFTIEPGIYIPEERIGVRIEDMFYVAADGTLVNMSRRLPKRIEEIERIMADAARQRHAARDSRVDR
jgi:Xaa-Pro aminopeptidase